MVVICITMKIDATPNDRLATPGATPVSNQRIKRKIMFNLNLERERLKMRLKEGERKRERERPQKHDTSR